MYKEKSKKEYTKPVIEKHKSIAVISGSGDGDCGCNNYSATQCGNTYYH